MSRLIGVLAVTLLVVGIVGCGEGSESSGDARPGAEITVEAGSLSKASFIERAKEICRERREKFEAGFASFLKRNGGLGSSRAELMVSARRLVNRIYLPAGKAQIAQISFLGAPEDDEAEVVAFLEAFQDGLEEAESHPVRFVRALNIDYEPFAEAEKLAAAYGFSECGKG